MDDLNSCSCSRVVRLDLPENGKTFWICNQCNAQFVPKKAVDYKLAHLQAELGRRVVDEQSKGMRRQDSVSE